MDEQRWERFAPLVAGFVGAVALIGAVGTFARWAVTEGFIAQNPIIGVILGLLGGMLCLGVAEPLWRTHRPTAQGLAGSGLAILSFAVYAGHAYVGAFSAPATLIALSAIAIAGVGLALRRDSELMAILGVVGGLAIPLMMPADRSLFVAYAVVLNGAAIAAATWHRWSVVPWLTVGATALLTGWWLAAGPPPGDLLTVVSMLVLPLVWGSMATWRRVPDRAAVAYVLGLPFGLFVFALSWSGFAPLVVTIVGASALLVVAPVALERFGPLGETLRFVAVAFGVVPWTGLAIRLLLDDALAWPAAAVLLLLPTVGSWGVQQLRPSGLRSSWIPRLTALVAASPLLLLFAQQLPGGRAQHAGIAAVVAAVGVLVDSVVTPERRWGRADDAGITMTLTGTLAALFLLQEADPGIAVVGAASVLAMSWGPLLFWPASDRGAHWMPVFVALPLLLPLGLAWRTGVGPGSDGVMPLLVAGLAALPVAWLDQGGLRHHEAVRQVAATAFGGIVLVCVTLAIPLQLSLQWLTIGWAMLGLAIVALARRSGSDGIAFGGLTLLAVVVVRLVFNPGVLTYHQVLHPQPLSWVLYGYALPVLALVGSARLLRLGADRASLTGTLRQGLRLAAIAVGFVGVNLFVSHAFTGGSTLSFADPSLSAQLFRTLSWMAYGVALLWLGAPFRGRLGIVALTAGALKVLLLDLWQLPGLGKALVLLGVALAMFVGAFLMQRARRLTPQSSGTSDRGW